MPRLAFKVEADSETANFELSASAVACADRDVREAEALMEGRAFVGFEEAAFLPRDGTDLSDLVNGVSESSKNSDKE